MSEPIKKGDICLVITGLGRHKSPNVGLLVNVESLQGEHSEHGRVWRCSGAGIKQLGDSGEYIITHWADFPANWLQKLEGPKIKPKEREVEHG